MPCLILNVFIFLWQVAISLGCIILSNTKNQDLLNDEPDFKFDVLLDLLKSKNTVTLFVYKNLLYFYSAEIFCLHIWLGVWDIEMPLFIFTSCCLPVDSVCGGISDQASKNIFRVARHAGWEASKSSVQATFFYTSCIKFMWWNSTHDYEWTSGIFYL
jgi:hypothetical protein